MAQWISAKGIAKKYQISEEEIEELINQQLITYSRLENTLIIDEESFVAYMELIRQIEDKRAIIEQLNQSEQLLETELQACNETAAAFVLEKQILPLYPLVVQMLSMLIPQGEARQIFNALALGGRLDAVARQFGMDKTDVLLIYNNTIQTISQEGETEMRQWMKRCAHLEMLNTQYANANIAQTKRRKKTEDDIHKQKIEMAEMGKQLTRMAKKREMLLVRIRQKETTIKQLKHELKLKKEQFLLLTPPLPPHQPGICRWIADSLHAAQGLIHRLFQKAERSMTRYDR